MKRIISILTVLICMLTFTVNVAAMDINSVDLQIKETSAALSALDGTRGAILLNNSDFPAGTSGCDWIAHALAMSGSEEFYAEYLASLQAYVEKQYQVNGYLHDIKATEYHRIAITVLALGENPESFGKRLDGSEINLIADGTYNYVGQELGMQGLNGWIWALIALDASGAEIPDNARYQRDDIIEAILAAQEPDGGFGLISGSSDVDITAMVLQALSPYKDNYGDEINMALNWLCTQMSDDCTFSYFGDESSESVSQVVIALCSLGIDPEENSNFVRGGNTLLKALSGFRKSDGTYSHIVTDDQGDSLATTQALQALLSLKGLYEGTGYVFSFKGINVPNQISAENADSIISNLNDSEEPVSRNHMLLDGQLFAACALLIVVVAVIIVVKKRSTHGTSDKSNSK